MILDKSSIQSKLSKGKSTSLSRNKILGLLLAFMSLCLFYGDYNDHALASLVCYLCVETVGGVLLQAAWRFSPVSEKATLVALLPGLGGSEVLCCCPPPCCPCPPPPPLTTSLFPMSHGPPPSLGFQIGEPRKKMKNKN